MQNLLLEEGFIINIKYVTLPQGKFLKLQPHSSTFLDISNPKAVLERALRSFAALTQGEDIALNYNNKNYYLTVLEVKPVDPTKNYGISILETDVDVDFAPPLDYKEPVKPKQEEVQTQIPAIPVFGKPAQQTPNKEEQPVQPVQPAFQPFTGGGYRLNGKPETAPVITTPNTGNPVFSKAAQAQPVVKGGYLTTGTAISSSPNTTSTIPSSSPSVYSGKLVFGATAPATATVKQTAIPKTPTTEPEKVEKGFIPFSGQGHSLKPNK